MASSSSTRTLRWLSLVAVIWLQSINGTNTNFPSYSSELKQLMSLSQLQLNNLAFASDAGKLFGFISGMAALHLPLWLVLFIGSILGLIGYGVQSLFLTYYDMIQPSSSSSLNYWGVFCLTVIAGNSICWINTVCYLVIVHNFPSHLQVAAGLSTSYAGLSAMIYAAVVNVVFHKRSSSSAAYLLLNATVPLAMSFIAAPFVRPLVSIGGKVKELRVGLIVITVITVSIGVYAMIASSLDYNNSRGVLMIGVGMCLALPIIVPLGELLRGFMILLMRNLCSTTISMSNYDQTKRRVCDESSCRHNSTDHDNKNHTAYDDDDDDDDDMPAMEEIGPKRLLKSLNFWLYFFVYSLGATIGLVYLNNLGQIAESRGWHDISSLVSLSSAFGFFGRLLPCILHCIWSRWVRLVPGPTCIFFMMVPLSGAFFLLLDGSRLSLCISTAIVGFCTGAITTICVSVTTQLFGRKNFGVNHNLVVANIPLGSFLFGDLAAFLYRRANADAVSNTRSMTNTTGRSCMGLSCYRDTFIIWGLLCSLGTFLAFILHMRTRKFYSTPVSVQGV